MNDEWYKPRSINHKEEKLKKYYDFYGELYKEKPNLLNVKIERRIFEDKIKLIEDTIKESAVELCRKEEVKQFLYENDVPDVFRKDLPDEYRVYCLLLNAIKQWVSKEQKRTDKYLLGANFNELCKKNMKECIIEHKAIKNGRLHHIVRDGRPPIYLSVSGHNKIENQSDYSLSTENMEIYRKVVEVKKKNQSWVQLKEGIDYKLGKIVNPRRNAISFANMIISKTDCKVDEISMLLEEMDIE